MNLNPIEWAQAQDLLVKLVHVLTPLTEKTVPASFFLSRRFVIPASLMQDDFSSGPLRHPVRVLPTLYSVQQQVEQWIAEAPQEAEARPAAPVPNEEKRTPPKEAPPISKQAQRLIDQVHDAIVILSTSTNMQDPQEAILRRVLAKLKPSLDRIVDSMAREKISLRKICIS